MSINGEEETQWEPKESTHCSWSAHAPEFLEIHFRYLNYQVYGIFFYSSLNQNYNKRILEDREVSNNQ